MRGKRLSDEEKRRFDSLSMADVEMITSITELQRLEGYMRSLGFAEFARYAQQRAQKLGMVDEKEEIKLQKLEIQSELLNWQKELEASKSSVPEVQGFQNIKKSIVKPRQQTSSHENANQDDSEPTNEQAKLQEGERDSQAKEYRIKGNESFRAGDYPEAVQMYSAGIEIATGNTAHTLHANRCAAYLKLKMYSDAEQDASFAIDLDPEPVKPWIRRALARQQLYEEARTQAKDAKSTTQAIKFIKGVQEDAKQVLIRQADNSEAQQLKKQADAILEQKLSTKAQIIEIDEEDEAVNKHKINDQSKENQTPNTLKPAVNSKIQVLKSREYQNNDEDLSKTQSGQKKEQIYKTVGKPGGTSWCTIQETE